MEYQNEKEPQIYYQGRLIFGKRLKVAREVFDQFGYRGIRTLMFEDYNVFSRNVGDTSDIVEKEMWFPW